MLPWCRTYVGVHARQIVISEKTESKSHSPARQLELNWDFSIGKTSTVYLRPENLFLEKKPQRIHIIELSQQGVDSFDIYGCHFVLAKNHKSADEMNNALQFHSLLTMSHF